MKTIYNIEDNQGMIKKILSLLSKILRREVWTDMSGAFGRMKYVKVSADTDSQKNFKGPRTVIALISIFALTCTLTFVATDTANAANVLTDSDMEAAGIGAWPHSDITAANSSAKAGDQVQGGVQSLKGTSATGKKINVGWYNQNTPSTGTINSTDTVLLSLWWGTQWNLNASGGAAGTLYVDITQAGTGWGSFTNIWS
jgi:hypothetical protein